MKKSEIIKQQDEYINELLSQIEVLIEQPISIEAIAIKKVHYLNKELQKDLLTGTGCSNNIKGIFNYIKP